MDRIDSCTHIGEQICLAGKRYWKCSAGRGLCGMCATVAPV
jgi:hypothetical protein